ncbi:D-alanyl-D-alanine carboxypeptidase [Hungatella effluvii]|uniref:D-alanyl-D-alanine carboxypeptidase n=1 Tax=Hungatella effluvii TaxID=1096246 RepID=A0A2V3XTA2_9FIRM|nr:serine hydrolase [Hungatella effluvii]PXX42889.1 D-alanyl-D-alanine carboxypeptidase [Hungatella effluvii]
MVKRFNRIWSIAISLSLLASVPAFGDIPIVPPISGGSDNGISGPETAGPGGDNTQSGPGASTGTGNSTGTGTSAGSGNSTGPGTSVGPGATQGSGTGGSVVNTLKQPEIQAQGAVLMDAATGNLLYSKEAETKFYPASITKLMTALLVAEKCSLDDTVTFSKTAVTNLESGAVTLGLVEGDKLTVRQSLYGLLLKSANEVANGLAEHTAGSISKFADMMNARAKELGCTNTNFVNPNGLNNSNHYTTPHDMALIARAAFQNGTVSKIASTLSYQIPATQKAAARTISLGHKMLYPNDARYYQGVIGGKTGYTSLAGNTLVTCAERDGVRLIAVIMKSKSTQYTDTSALLDYGFALKNGGSQTAKWQQEGAKWYFVKNDGNRAANEWMTIDGADYWFDSDGTMATGWRHYSNDVWYYFKSGGAMASSTWVESDGQWFYLGADGAMMKNTVTPDGYTLDASGVWVK